jgi:hypothetical protein
MSRFDPIAAGFVGDGHGGFAMIDRYGACYSMQYDGEETWNVCISDGDEFGFRVPVKFDHAHVVELLRANGADIEGGDDE